MALCSRDDAAFRACAEALKEIPLRTRAVTTVACVTEAMYLLGRVRGGQSTLLRLLQAERFALDALPIHSLARIETLLSDYADRPMDFADATVVELAERLGTESVFTLDEQDFRVYWPKHVRHFRLLPADF